MDYTSIKNHNLENDKTLPGTMQTHLEHIHMCPSNALEEKTACRPITGSPAGASLAKSLKCRCCDTTVSSISHQHLRQKLQGLALASSFCASLGPQACPSLQQSRPPMTTDLPSTMRATSRKMRGLQVGGHSSQSGTTQMGGRDTGGGRDRQEPESDRVESASWRRDWEHYSLSGDLTGRESGPKVHRRPGSKQFRLNSYMCSSDHYHGKATRQHVIKGL